MRRIETTIAGIAIPDSALAREATEFVREASTPLLFHHSRRVFVWASLQAERLSLGRAVNQSPVLHTTGFGCMDAPPTRP